ncbi:hypothetical protein [Actinomadura nitritigenes]
MQRPGPGFDTNWPEAGFSRQTVRQVVRATEQDAGANPVVHQYGGSP